MTEAMCSKNSITQLLHSHFNLILLVWIIPLKFAFLSTCCIFHAPQEKRQWFIFSDFNSLFLPKAIVRLKQSMCFACVLPSLLLCLSLYPHSSMAKLLSLTGSTINLIGFPTNRRKLLELISWQINACNIPSARELRAQGLQERTLIHIVIYFFQLAHWILMNVNSETKLDAVASNNAFRFFLLRSAPNCLLLFPQYKVQRLSLSACS